MPDRSDCSFCCIITWFQRVETDLRSDGLPHGVFPLAMRKIWHSRKRTQ